MRTTTIRAVPGHDRALPLPGVPYDETPAADGIPSVVQRSSTRAPVDERKRSRDSGKGRHHLRQRKEAMLDVWKKIEVDDFRIRQIDDFIIYQELDESISRIR